MTFSYNSLPPFFPSSVYASLMSKLKYKIKLS